uniref:Small ribosomal subunit protein uS11c n=1 Tax=Trachelomonas grandis TaxID=215769 RepID=A0A385UK26_9EUGL|nr:ribosomal protein S11 [Trachelomonas grandis]
MVKQKKLVVKSVKRKIYRGIIHVKTSFNNAIVSVSDLRGNIVSWSSAGSCGFKGSRKSTPFATQLALELAVKRALEFGLKQVEVNLKGPGSGRETAIRSLQSLGLGILSLKDVTPLPHNGCRPANRRRI